MERNAEVSTRKGCEPSLVHHGTYEFNMDLLDEALVRPLWQRSDDPVDTISDTASAQSGLDQNGGSYYGGIDGLTWHGLKTLGRVVEDELVDEYLDTTLIGWWTSAWTSVRTGMGEIMTVLAGASAQLLEDLMQPVAPAADAEPETSTETPPVHGIPEVDGPPAVEMSDKQQLWLAFHRWADMTMAATKPEKWLAAFDDQLASLTKHGRKFPDDFVEECREWLADNQKAALSARTTVSPSEKQSDTVFQLPAKRIVELKPGAEPNWKNIEHEERKTLTTEQALDLLDTIKGRKILATSPDHSVRRAGDNNLKTYQPSFDFKNLVDLIDKCFAMTSPYGPDRIGVLEIAGHGGPDGMNFGRNGYPEYIVDNSGYFGRKARRKNPRFQEKITAGILGLDNYIDASNVRVVAKTLRTSLYWSENSVIVLGACNAGNLKQADSWPQQLADLTGSYVLAPAGFTNFSLLNSPARGEIITRSTSTDFVHGTYRMGSRTWYEMLNDEDEEEKHFDSQQETWYLFIPTIFIYKKEAGATVYGPEPLPGW